jgi:hypothetical protein
MSHVPSLRRAALGALIVLAAWCGSGCDFPWSREPPVQHEILSFHTTPAAGELKKVALLPFWIAEGVGRSSGALNENLYKAMLELGQFEVTRVSLEERDALLPLPRDPIQANRITVAELQALSAALHVDGVLLGRIDHFDSYDPISLGLTADLVSCRDGQPLWSATGHFDGRRADVQEEIRCWHARTAGTATDSITGWKLVLSSPQLFTRYVADRLALSVPMPPAPPKP